MHTGGRIEFTSREGVGTTFRVELPLGAKHPRASRRSRAPRNARDISCAAERQGPVAQPVFKTGTPS